VIRSCLVVAVPRRAAAVRRRNHPVGQSAAAARAAMLQVDQKHATAAGIALTLRSGRRGIQNICGEEPVMQLLIGRGGFACSCCVGALAGWTRQLGMSPAMAAPDGGPQVAPVEKTSFHIPIFTNEHVTLLHVVVPPGHTSGYHKHSVDTASVVVESAN